MISQRCLFGLFGSGLQVSGVVKAGRWESGQLAAPLMLWRCAAAAEAQERQHSLHGGEEGST
jgi:hypothetical protein